MKRISLAVWALWLSFASSAALAQTVVNIDARVSGIIDPSTFSNPAVVALAAGSYTATPFDNSGSPGGFTAWNAWSTVTGCDPSGANCATGWLNSFAVKTAGQQRQTAGTGTWATPALAIANTRSLCFTVAAAGNVEFAVTDSYLQLTDNTGGVSLRIQPVATCVAPTTAAIPTLQTWAMTLLMLALAAGGVLALRRR